MESQLSSPPSVDHTLRARDYFLLLLLCAVLYGFSLVQPRVFTTHETTHCLNVREMFQSGEYLIPTYGGRPWLERPPAPHWLTGIFANTFGDTNREWAMRLGSIFIATLAVLVLAWAVAGSFGRSIGLMSGAILATMREFAAYAVGPEADIFLASTVTICGALFLRLQWAQVPQRAGGFVALVFFFLLGLMNWMKGPLFGMIFVLLPIGGCFVWSRDWSIVRRFTSIGGLLLLLVVGTAWPLLAWLRYPDIVELWMVDYGIRWQSGYIGQPFWYYLVHQPWNVFPWTIPALAGLLVTARLVFYPSPTRSEGSALVFNPSPTRSDGAALRFIWCWAILPVAFFSLFKGKHHHYMLSCLAPAAVLGAFGSVAVWNWIRTWPARLRQPWLSLILIGVPGSVLVFFFGKKIPGPEWIRWMVMFGWPAVAFLTWWTLTRRDGRIAFAGTCALIVVLNCLAYVHRSHCMDSYVADRAFVEQVGSEARADVPLLVINDEHPLNSSWLVYYLGERAQLLHNHTFLRDERIAVQTACVICRQRDEVILAQYGTVRILAQSAKARGELSPADRWTLYELQYHPHLERVPGNVRISPMQATGRKPGPFLGHDPRLAGR
jgi:4-amino-4-deoxy-L-arabinose transferase-like glycosyltransferase